MSGEKTLSAERSSVESAPAPAHEFHWGQSVLLVGGSTFRKGLRASILRAHGLQVEMSATLAEGRTHWQPNTFDWVLLDVHSQLPGEVVDFCKQLKHVAPGQRIAFFVGPPTYVSLRWPGEGMVHDEKETEHVGTLKAAA